MILVITTVILGIVIALGIVVALMVWRKRKKGTLEEVNYRAFFVMGIIMAPLGIVSMIIYFLLQIPFFIAFPIFGVGIIYLIIGWAHRDKWRKSA